MNGSKFRAPIFGFHLLELVMLRTHILHRYAVDRVQIHEFLNLVQVKFTLILRADKMLCRKRIHDLHLLQCVLFPGLIYQREALCQAPKHDFLQLE
jgi:hypothetical protein